MDIQEIRKEYNSPAEYEKQHSTPAFMHVRSVEKSLFRELKPPIIDIGSGTGEVWKGFENDITAVDISMAMLERNPSRRKVIADALNLPFPDCSFNSATCLLMTANIIPIEQLAEEVRRVLREGGLFLFSHEVGNPRIIRRKGLEIRIHPRNMEFEGFKIKKHIKLFRLFKPSWRYFYKGWEKWALAIDRFVPAWNWHAEVLLLERI